MDSHRHRDADEEALQAALFESVQPDYLAEILEAESQRGEAPRAQLQDTAAVADNGSNGATGTDLSDDGDAGAVQSDADADEDLAAQVDHLLQLSDESDVDEEEDANLHHVFLNFAEYLIIDILRYLDEDSIGNALCSCKRLHHVARADELFETLCRRIFPVQCPKVAVAAAADRFALRKFRTWFDMFYERPRVRYNGFYWLKISYYKKPELNMWTDITPGTILQVIYYRYFSFQRDGTVLYGMLFKPPHEVTSVLRAMDKGVYVGRYHVERDEVFVSVPTSHNVVEFRLRISKKGRGKNVKLILAEHYSFSEPDRTGWVNYYDTAEEEFQYYRSWNL
uniref:F-box protein Hrt3/FBXO9 C-terminal domain-containing protein n=1 Tax=Globisporangium ultimum (strain ATCC 200006 / CBS 805.95 / DAOM BR144) TaxID=431595 RepID=K3X1T4_GLOUD